MATLDHLRGAGLIIEKMDGRLRVSPAERITPEIRQYIITHKAALLAELSITSTPIQQAANSINETARPEPPQGNTVSIIGNTPTREQTDSPAHILTAATASPDWLLARDQYMGHLMTCATCYAPTGRYCATGADLRQQYQFTPMEPTP